MIYLRLALLSVLKYRKRTVAIVIGVALSVVVMLVVAGMLDGMRKSFYREIIQDSGHIQLHRSGWEDRIGDATLTALIDAPEEVLTTVRRHNQVVRAEQVLLFGAMLIQENENVGMLGHGIETDSRAFGAVREKMVAGSFFTADEPAMLISTSIADLLSIGLGDELLVLVETTMRSPWYLSYPVTGIYETGVAETDDYAFFIPHRQAQELLFAERQTSEIRMTLKDYNAAAAVVSELEPVCREHDLVAQTWREIHGSIVVLVEAADVLMLLINVFVVIVAATVITNAILMTAFDRIATFGALRAIGLKRRQLVGMVMNEGAIVGVAGSLVGLAIGIPVVLILQRHGLNIGELGDYFGTGQRYYFDFRPLTSLIVFALGTLISIAGAAYAGWATARMGLIESLQQK
jgi:putative ABC transport system permease protein